MSDCCASEIPKMQCPADGTLSKQVSVSTIKHQLKEPWFFELQDNVFYYCHNPECDVAYFGSDNTLIKSASLRNSDINDEIICYCYGVTREDYENNQSVKEFIIQETKAKNCACEARNPSGRCCLTEFK